MLSAYANALGVEEGSHDWEEFVDLAAAERGRVPEDLLTDSEVVDRLPVLFRMLRGTKSDRAKLDALIDKIRRA